MSSTETTVVETPAAQPTEKTDSPVSEAERSASDLSSSTKGAQVLPQILLEEMPDKKKPKVQGPQSSTKETCCELVCGCVTRDNSKELTVIWFSPEHWRALMYIGFLLMSSIDFVVTTVFTDMTNWGSSMLTRMYGYNNLCIYIDFEPATYFTPFLCVLWIIVVAIWTLVTELRNRAAEGAGYLNQGTRCCLSGCLYIVAITFAFFITSTAYQPGDGLSEHAALRMILHTIPFALLQVGLVSLSISETVYGVGGYWTRIGTPTWLRSGACVYCALLIGIVGYKMVFYVYAWSVFPTTYMNFTVDGEAISLPANEFAPTTKIILKILDYGYMVLALLIPFGKTLGVIFCKRHDLEKLRIEYGTQFAPGH